MCGNLLCADVDINLTKTTRALNCISGHVSEPTRRMLTCSIVEDVMYLLFVDVGFIEEDGMVKLFCRRVAQT